MNPIQELSKEAGIFVARNVLIPFTRAVLEEIESELSEEIHSTFRKHFQVPSFLGKLFQ